MLVGGFPGTEQNNETNSDVTDNYQRGVNYDMTNWLLHVEINTRESEFLIGLKFVNPCK